MRLVNLTKLALRLYDADGKEVVIHPDPRHVALVTVADHQTVEDEQGRRFSVTEQRVRGVKGMPEPQPDTLYVVHMEIAVTLCRDDVVYLAEDALVRLGAGEMRRITHFRRLVFPTEDRERAVPAQRSNGEP